MLASFCLASRGRELKNSVFIGIYLNFTHARSTFDLDFIQKFDACSISCCHNNVRIPKPNSRADRLISNSPFSNKICKSLVKTHGKN